VARTKEKAEAGKILAVCMSEKKGTPKKNVKKAELKVDHGVVGDAHAGPGIRQVSLLAKESIDMIRKKGIKLGCGGFAENLTTSGMELTSLPIGTKLKAGEAVLEVTKIGKECKKPCAIMRRYGECILPSQGIFAKVLTAGVVKQGDSIGIISEGKIAAGILIVSDRSARGEREDACGDIIAAELKKIDSLAVRRKIIPDEEKEIASALKKWADSGEVDLIITSGGTGFSPRDVTPEATKKVIDRDAPGLAEMMRIESAEKTKFAYLSRGVSGIRKKTLIINLPGSPKAAAECMKIVSALLRHAVEVMKGRVKDCHPGKSGH